MIEGKRGYEAVQGDVSELVDRFWQAMTSFDFDALRQTVTDDFLCWYNTPLLQRQEIDLQVFIRDVMEMEMREGMKVLIRDVRRHPCAIGLVQQDVATVRRGNGESFEFARCHVLQVVENRIARWWEYYDTASILIWEQHPSPLRVLEPA